MRVAFFSLFLLLYLFDGLSIVHAQMFSVKSRKKKEIEEVSSIIVTSGINFTQFTYNGSTPNSYSRPTGQFAFNSPTYFIHGQFGLVHLHFDYGNRLGPNELLRYSNISLTIEGGIALARTKKFDIILPMLLTTDSFTISSQAITSDANRFEQTGFTFGTGGQFRFTLAPWLKLKLSQLAHYGYSSQGFGSDYGSKLLVESKAQLTTLRLFKNSNLVFTSTYRYHNYNLDEFLFDYRMNALTFGIGLTF